ncbi:sigma-70 family RNA polymerase sigma factor [Bacillus sp. JCM 19034]|uniref:sigma-70 family RNA polymerase sigma factor n=1 Tax=Bacillus sp. JCM 19034 TaxID=1481928 RepID=UPI000785FEDA|nr:sigma-70 family RNA polymerase sigma factor [Bacillus sp. JCM 19034]
MLTDEKLINLIAEERKEEIIEIVMAEYGEKLTRLAYSYLKDWGLAEDAVQEVFVKCYHSLDRFRMESSIQTWLYMITSNQCKDILRSSSFRKILSQIPFLKLHPATQITPELIILEREQDERIAKALLMLPIKYREVMIFYYYENVSISGIAKILKVNENTIKTRLRRGKQLLKEMIRRNEID